MNVQQLFKSCYYFHFLIAQMIEELALVSLIDTKGQNQSWRPALCHAEAFPSIFSPTASGSC